MLTVMIKMMVNRKMSKMMKIEIISIVMITVKSNMLRMWQWVMQMRRY